MNIPILVKILVSLSTILVVNRFVKSLSISLLAGTAVLAVWSGHSPDDILNIAWDMVYSLDNAMLSLLIILVIWLSSQMNAAEIMGDLVTSVKSKLSVKGAVAILPAIIGLLPMPGGALFSAPLVDDCDENASIDPILKTKINYWFRHIWEYIWPLYPGIILASDISGLQIWQLFLLGMPMTIAAAFFGWVFLLRKIGKGPVSEKRAKSGLFRLILPIIVVVAVYIVILLFIPSIQEISKYLPMAFGLIIAMVVLQIERPVSWEAWKKIIVNRKPLAMVVIVVLVSVYGAFIETRLPDGVFLMDQMRMELDRAGIPIIVLVMLIPFISGLTTGITVGFVGASFPIVISLLGANPGMEALLPTIILAFSFGFMGLMLSPVHVCLIVTNEHFKTSLWKSLSSLTPMIISMLIFALVYSQIILKGVL